MFPVRYTFLFLLSLPFLASAQTHPSAVFWQKIKETDIQAEWADRRIVPLRYKTLHLDDAGLKNYLATAPAESDLIAGKRGLELMLPLPSGGFERIEVWRVPVMHPDLEAQYPQIRTFAGRGLDHREISVRLDYTGAGFHAMVRGGTGGAFFIDPYATGNPVHYVCYFKKDFVKKNSQHWACAVDGNSMDEPEIPQAGIQDRAGDCGKLRTYRLALACTGEYAEFHGATAANKDPALQAMITSVNRINGVYEIDLGVRLLLIANNSVIIYTDPATDPYTNDDGGIMLDENIDNLAAVIGNANFDIGHVFSTGGGGIAFLGAVCNNNIKAGGVTGSSVPVGDPFDIDYVAHEMGHQFSGNHTQYNDCNRNNGTAVEPGSASTIMGYAGICSPDVQPHSDAYFHSTNLIEMGTFIIGSGNSCAVQINNGNTAPSLSSLTSRTIPKSTPFFLTASATDANGDPLTYCWEQWDNTGSDPQPPVSTNPVGPMFRSYEPVASPTRYFPKFSDVLAGIDDDWEELPSVTRDLKMRVLVRDNHVNGGCTSNLNMTVTVSATSGPFVVTSPNTAVILASGSTDVVTWNVANTTASPVSCANVDILISTDGGANFTSLISNTPNDGSQTVTYPNVTSAECRIMVRSAGNVFYDVSDVNFLLGNYQNYCNLIFASLDVPKTIPTEGTVTSTLTVPANGFVSDVDVINLIGNHTWINDLSMTLTSPSGLERILLDDICDDEDNFNINFNDESTNPYANIPCPPIGGGTYKPLETLSPFDGSVSNDTWTLTITDHVANDGGLLIGWGLKLCILSTTPLPVELKTFTARLVNETAHLSWTTASEHNNRGFHIERSIGHALDFQTIGWMPGHHTTNESHAYVFDDQGLKPGQLYYYRLRQESENGETDYSNVEVVSMGKNAGLLHIYPNPAKTWLNLELPKSLEATSMTVTVWDARGRLVEEQQLNAGSPLDVSQQAQGMYWVQVVAEGAVLRGKYYVGW